MADFEDKENVAPSMSSDQFAIRPLRKNGQCHECRCEIIGANEIHKLEIVRKDAKIRRDVAFMLRCKPIISTDVGRPGRQAARRNFLADRRVSFAPEVTLHTWYEIDFQSDETTSPDSSKQTRRSGNSVTPFKQLDPLGWVREDLPTCPREPQDESEGVPSAPAPHCHLVKKQGRQSYEFTSMTSNRHEASASIAICSNTYRTRPRSVAEAGSPGAEVPAVETQRSRRSLVPRSFMVKDRMDLNIAISSNRDAAMSTHRESKRRCPSTLRKPAAAAVDPTRAARVVEAAAACVEPATSSAEEHVELTNVPEVIKAAKEQEQ
ncbi:hypothetical protein LTR48_002874 [Friedmanniomyces endolithicus]|nr:hypothetical protein LTR48_002874 [Friedmanniomyces endolithicus]